MLQPHHIDAAKAVADVASVAAVGHAWLASGEPLLTMASTVVAFVYVIVRLYETKTAQKILDKIRGED